MPSESYFSFNQPTSNRSGDESPLLSPGSTEPPPRFSGISSALSSTSFRSANSKSVGFSLGDVLGQRKDKQTMSTQASTLSPTTQNHRMGFAFRRLSRITGISRPHPKQTGEYGGKQNMADVSLKELSTPSNGAGSDDKNLAGTKHDAKDLVSKPSGKSPPTWLSETDSGCQQDATGLYNRSGRRTGISLARHSTYAEASPPTEEQSRTDLEANVHGSQQSAAIPPATRHQTFNYSLSRQDTGFPTPAFRVQDRPLSYLPTEARRIDTPPASAEPRLDPFTLTPNPRMASPIGKASQITGSANTRQGASSHSLYESMKQDEDDVFRRKWDYPTGTSPNAENIIDDSIPEHLPSSPLCPRHPKHKSGRTGTCPSHGQNEL